MFSSKCPEDVCHQVCIWGVAISSILSLCSLVCLLIGLWQVKKMIHYFKCVLYSAFLNHLCYRKLLYDWRMDIFLGRKTFAYIYGFNCLSTTVQHRWKELLLFFISKKNMYLPLKSYFFKNIVHFFPSPLVILTVICNWNFQNDLLALTHLWNDSSVFKNQTSKLS